MSIEDLCGRLKSYSDLRKHQIRIRYTEATSVAAGGWFRTTFSRHSDSGGSWYLDARNCFLRFKMNITPVGTDKNWIDGPSAASIFDRVRVVCNSTVLADIQSYPLLVQMLEGIYHSDATESTAVQTLRGHGTLTQRMAWGAGVQEYIIPIMPIHSLLNSKNLIPLNQIGDLHVEFYLGSAASVLAVNGSSTPGTYRISDIEVHAHYLSSKSITSYFQSNPPQYSCVDYSYRFNACTSMVNMLKISSSNTSLNTVLGYLHQSQTALNSNRRCTSYDPANLQSLQMYINNLQLHEIPIDSKNQLFKELQESFPEIESSEHFTDFNSVLQFLICVNLRAAPKEFVQHVTSGMQTSSLNSDICLNLNFTSAPPADLVLESFLISDCTVYSSGKDLMIKY